MKPLKQNISISLDENIIRELRDKANYEDRSLSQYINVVLKKHLEELSRSPKVELWG